MLFLDFLAALKQGYTDPRASARRLLSRGMTLRDCALMAVLALCIMTLGEKLAGLVLDGGAEATGLPMLVSRLALQFLQLFVMATASHLIGAKFGGKASRTDMAALAAWHLVLQAVLSPLQVIAILMAASGGAGASVLVLPLIFSVGLLIWVYASFVAEAHGFKRIGPVLVAVFLGFMALGVMAQVVLQALATSLGGMPAPPSGDMAALTAPFA